MENMDVVVNKFDCTMCKSYLPCQKASGKTDDIVCEKFINLFPDEVDEVDYSAMNASIPDDEILPDYTECQESLEKELLMP